VRQNKIWNWSKGAPIFDDKAPLKCVYWNEWVVYLLQWSEELWGKIEAIFALATYYKEAKL
jgi:hypothetical protein